LAPWWQRRITAAMDLGIDGWTEDFGEAIEAGMQFANGQLGAAMHNQYPVLYHRATREAVDRYQAAHPEREIWFFTRSGFSGSACYEGGNFPGDNSGDFGRANGLGSSCRTLSDVAPLPSDSLGLPVSHPVRKR
jgi:alpha-glucosidase